jgi:hypothetical protein
MPFWSDASFGTPDPKRKYRWLVQLGGMPPWIAKKVSKPGWEVSETKHNYLIHQFYYPGRVTWKDVSLTLVDPAGAGTDTMQTIYNKLVESGYAPPESETNYNTISRSAAVTSLGRVVIQQIGDAFELGGEGESLIEGTSGTPGRVVEEWVLYNAWIKDVDLGDLDYESDDLVELALTLRYDYAKLNTANSPHSPGVPGREDGFGTGPAMNMGGF